MRLRIQSKKNDLKQKKIVFFSNKLGEFGNSIPLAIP